jgi:hypothetical protein
MLDRTAVLMQCIWYKPFKSVHVSCQNLVEDFDYSGHTSSQTNENLAKVHQPSMNAGGI